MLKHHYGSKEGPAVDGVVRVSNTIIVAIPEFSHIVRLAIYNVSHIYVYIYFCLPPPVATQMSSLRTFRNHRCLARVDGLLASMLACTSSLAEFTGVRSSL